MLEEAGGHGSWAWEEEKAWEVDKLWTSLGCEHLRTDPDGWVYASGWNDMLAKIYGAPHELGHERPKHPAGTVRRRRWIRWREPAGWTGKDGFEVTHTIKVDDSTMDTREWCVGARRERGGSGAGAGREQSGVRGRVSVFALTSELTLQWPCASYKPLCMDLCP